MDTSAHTMNTLFEQLGLASTDAQVDQFINTHKLFSDQVKLEDATFWNKGQADFLRDAISNDSDWAEIVDELNSRLRG